MGWSLGAFELATKYVSSSWPYKFFLTNVPPLMYSNLLRLLFSLELRLNNGRTFCRTAGVSDYCHVGLVSCQTNFLAIYGCPLAEMMLSCSFAGVKFFGTPSDGIRVACYQ